MIRYPAPLVPGDTIAVTSPSSGVAERHRDRLEVAVGVLRERGYDVVVGDCMDGSSHVSAPAAERAAELTAYLVDPRVRAIVPPWGGETAIDLLPLLDWGAIGLASADAPTWCVGYSDSSTLWTPLTLLAGVATIHGTNLMDTPYAVPEGLVHWLDIATAAPGSRIEQSSPGRYRVEGWDDWTAHPEVAELTLDGSGSWVRLDAPGEDVDVAGRLIGGCIETLANLAGTPYLDVTAWADRHASEGLIAYVEAAGDDAFTICRQLHGMRLAGFFDRAVAVLVGRTRAPDAATLTQHEAVLDALGPLGVPIVADVECGHVPPYLPLVNGALARVRHGSGVATVVQTLA